MFRARVPVGNGSERNEACVVEAKADREQFLEMVIGHRKRTARQVFDWALSAYANFTYIDAKVKSYTGINPEWGWANHCVPADRLIEAVEALAARIALVPADVLRVKKLSVNRAAEAAGFRSATAGIAEMDSLLHLAPSVLVIWN